MHIILVDITGRVWTSDEVSIERFIADGGGMREVSEIEQMMSRPDNMNCITTTINGVEMNFVADKIIATSVVNPFIEADFEAASTQE